MNFKTCLYYKDKIIINNTVIQLLLLISIYYITSKKCLHNIAMFNFFFL